MYCVYMSVLICASLTYCAYVSVHYREGGEQGGKNGGREEGVIVYCCVGQQEAGSAISLSCTSNISHLYS